MSMNIVNMNKKYIERGDMLYVNDTGLEVGSEMKKRRPCVVVSNNKCNKSSRCIEIVYITSSNNKPHIPTHVPIHYCGISGTVLCESVYTVDISRVTEFLGKCRKETLKEIDEALCISLNLNPKSVYISKDTGSDSSTVVEAPTVKSDGNVNRIAFITGGNETLVQAAEIIREINELGMKINNVEKFLSSDYKHDTSALESVLPQNKIDEIQLLMLLKIEEEKNNAEAELKRIIEIVKNKSVYISSNTGNLSIGNTGNLSMYGAERDTDCGNSRVEPIVSKVPVAKPKSEAEDKGPLTPETKDLIYRMLDEGYSNTEIAIAADVSNRRVRDYRSAHKKMKAKGKNAGTRNYSTRLPQEVRDEIYRMILDGCSNEEVGTKFGLTNNHVSEYRHRAKKKGLI